MNQGKEEEGGIPRWPEKENEPKPGELDEQQARAGRRAHELFVGMAEHGDHVAPRATELDSFLPRLDANRGNHTVLIDGSRGSGKTAVMLRLLQDWSDHLTKRPSATKLVFKGVAQLIPVGLLDLEAVPPSANLATRIAGIFERVVAAIEGRGTRKDPARAAPAWAALEDDTLPSRQAWQHFVSAAALEWDRSLERRRTSIDPEAYAVEVEQAERKGLQARECFRKFVDALGEDWAKWPPYGGERPFFIVPIDDADLNPGRVVELFGLVRTLWHPRVGYLVTGDSRLFAHVLATHFRHQIDVPTLQVPPMSAGFVRLTLDPSRQAERLATDVYEKAVPPAQRFHLKPLTGPERLSFIHEALTNHIDVGASTDETLSSYLGADNSSSLALPGRWRRLRDLRSLIMRGDFSVPLGAARFAVELLNLALEESDLDEQLKGKLPKPLSFGDQGILWRQLLAEDVTISTHRLPGGLRGSAIFISKMALDIRPFDNDRRAKIDPGPAVIGALFLAINLHRRETNTWYVGESLSFRLIEVRTEVTYEYDGKPENQPSFFTFRWPIPQWRPYLEKQRFYENWNAQVDVWRSAGDTGQFAREFLRLVLQASRLTIESDADWGGLAHAIVVAASDSSSLIGKWALRYSGLLAAPESGLLPRDAADWLTALYMAAGANWPKFANALFQTRRERAGMAIDGLSRPPGHERPVGDKLEAEIGRALGHIDAFANGFNWKTLIEPPTP